MFKRYLIYEFPSIECQVANHFSLAEFAWQILYSQWPKERGQKDKQRSTNHTHKTKETRTSLKTRGELRRSGRVSSCCSTSGTRCVDLVPNPVIIHERGKDREVFTTSRCLSFCPLSFGHCFVSPSTIYGFWLPPFWYLQTLLSFWTKLYYI
jgi:hypothetical protein